MPVNGISQIGSSPLLVYFDNGATTQKPHCVIDSYHTFYQTDNANVHRASHALSARATTAFEHARNTVKTFINAKSNKEIIWTKGTTEGINLIAMTLGRKILKRGDEILLATSEHHANIVPWQLIAEQTGAVIKAVALDAMGCVNIADFEQNLNSKTKLFCCAHLSNVIAKINPVSDLIKKAKSVGAITVIDGAQAVAHFPIDVQVLDCDFYVFSAHKMYGPTGVGILYGKQALLEKMPPYQGGGEMIKQVSFNAPTTFNTLPFKFEAGTPNIAGVIAFSKAIEFISGYDAKEIYDYEKKLTSYSTIIKSERRWRRSLSSGLTAARTNLSFCISRRRIFITRLLRPNVFRAPASVDSTVTSSTNSTGSSARFSRAWKTTD